MPLCITFQEKNKNSCFSSSNIRDLNQQSHITTHRPKLTVAILLHTCPNGLHKRPKVQNYKPRYRNNPRQKGTYSRNAFSLLKPVKLRRNFRVKPPTPSSICRQNFIPFVPHLIEFVVCIVQEQLLPNGVDLIQSGCLIEKILFAQF